MNKWKSVKLGEVCKINMGQSPKSDYYNMNGQGLPFLQGNRTFGVKYPTFDTYTTQAIKVAEAGDVIMSVRAPVGDVNITPVKMCLGRGVCSLRHKDDEQEFLYYLMRYYAHELISRESGTVFGSVNHSDIANLEVEIPPLFAQREIAAILSALDAKIANNTAINHNLEQMAQAVFKSWFVDFEPWGGVMPDDWRETELGDVTTLSAGGDKPVICSLVRTDRCNVPIFSNGIDNFGLYGYTEFPKITEESVTVSARGTIGFVCLRRDPFVPIVRLVTAIPDNNFITAKYLYLYLKNIHIAGVGTTQQQLTVPDFKKYRILVPSFEAVNDFTQIANPIFDTILHKQDETTQLAETRDVLLPRLMSGELSVSGIAITNNDLSKEEKSVY